MKKTKYIFLALIGLALTLSACSDGSEIDKTLETDETKVLLTSEAQTKSVPFTASKGESVIADWDGENWGAAVVDPATGTVVMTVQENPLPTLRRATVVVSLTSGWRNQVIEVTQNGGNSVLATIPDEVIFDFMGCEQTIQIPAKIGVWSVEKEATWVYTTKYTQAKELTITLDENTGTETRAAFITITSGTASKEVILRQDAVPLFMLPIVNFNKASMKELRAFEKSRHNSFVGQSGDVVFTTPSPMFPVLRYEMAWDSDAVDAARLGVPTEYTDILANDYPKFLEECGFEYLKTSANGVYYWLDFGPKKGTKHCMARLVPGSVFFTSETIKPVSAPTFDVFPYPAKELVWGVNEDVVRAWEAKNGGTLSDEMEKELDFGIPSSTELYLRMYFFNQAPRMDLNSMNTIYYGVDKFFNWAVYRWVLSPSLFELLLKEGFVHVGNQAGTGSPVFENTDKDLTVAISAYKGVNDLPADPPTHGGLRFFPAGYFQPSAAQGEAALSNVRGAIAPAPVGLQYVSLDIDVD